MAGMSISLLIGGAFLLLLGLVSTFTGKASSRFSWVYRAESPKTFWWIVAVYYLGGIFLVGRFLFQT
jgi:hypothetical protein